MDSPTKFLKTVVISGDVAIKDLPETLYILSTSQKIRVIQPIAPAVIAPSFAPLKTKNRAKAIEKSHKPLRTSQLTWNTSGLASNKRNDCSTRY